MMELTRATGVVKHAHVHLVDTANYFSMEHFIKKDVPSAPHHVQLTITCLIQCAPLLPMQYAHFAHLWHALLDRKGLGVVGQVQDNVWGALWEQLLNADRQLLGTVVVCHALVLQGSTITLKALCQHGKVVCHAWQEPIPLASIEV
jgi:hypothetical protein